LVLQPIYDVVQIIFVLLFLLRDLRQNIFILLLQSHEFLLKQLFP
jgi:hypothetical protein